MKKLDEPLSNNYLPIKLNLKDLFDIENVMKEYSDSVEIEAEGFQFSSIDELSDKLENQSFSKMMIKISNPYTYIDLDRLWARIYVGSSNKDGSGLFYKMDVLLKKARRPLWFLYSYYLFILYDILFFLFEYWKNFVDGIVPLLLFIVSSVWMLWMFYVRMRRHSLIVISKNNSFRNLWIRKRDDIILVLISSIIGAILGVLGTLLINNFSK